MVKHAIPEVDPEFDIVDSLRAEGFTFMPAEPTDGFWAVGLQYDTYGDVSILLNRKFVSDRAIDMAVLTHRGLIDEQVLYQGVAPTSKRDYDILMEMLFPSREFRKSLEGYKVAEQRNYLRRFDSLERTLYYKGDIFVPMLYKHETEFNDHACWCMYAKKTEQGFSSAKVLFAVKGTTAEVCLAKFYDEYSRLCVERIIIDKEWRGAAPYRVDFCND